MGQGREILGFGLKPEDLGEDRFLRIDRFDRREVRKGGRSIADFAVTGTGMSGTLDGTPLVGEDWIGVTFVGEAHYSKEELARPIVRITHAKERAPGPSPTQALAATKRWEYRFELVSDPPQATGKDLCLGEETLATPIAGYWDVHGKYHSNDKFSFACHDRIAATCNDLGYTIGNDALEPLFEACTRMMRADYCGNGISHTVDHTLVQIWDTKKIQELKPVEGMTFEAAWLRDGALCLDHVRHPPGSQPDDCCDLAKIPRCSTPEAAQSQTNKPLVFNQSVPPPPTTTAGKP